MDPIKTVSLHIAELDCAEEVVVLRRALESQSGVERIDFDVLHARMNVTFDEQTVAVEEIAQRIRTAGMTAQLWSEHTRQQASGTAAPRVNARFWLTLLAGCVTAAAFAIHWFSHGSFRAAFGHQFEQHVATVPWLSKGLYGVAILVGLWFVVPKAWLAITKFRADMNLLMCVAVVGAIALGHWLEAAMVTLLFSVALLLESWSVRKARRAIETLLDVTPKTAHRVCDTHGDDHDVAVDSVQVKSRIRVYPSEQIPLDGVILEGTSAINQSAITGESIPVDKSAGASVYAGTINGQGTIMVEVTRPASDTTLARIIRMVEQARSRQAESEQWVEKFARYYTPVVMAISALIFAVPTLVWGGEIATWAYNALVLLVIACPCALVISTPVSIVAGLTSAAREGVTIKGGRFLEAIGRVRSVAIDKTGTITRGRPEVLSIVASDGNETSLLQLAAALERQNSHPIARAIIAAATEANLEIPLVQDYQAITSGGATGTVGGLPRWIGNERLARQQVGAAGVLPDLVTPQSQGHTVVLVGSGTNVAGLICVADQLRREAIPAIRQLKQNGVAHIQMLTGDHAGAADAIAKQAGVDSVAAELLPADKVAAVEALRRRFSSVAMIGDGVNDSPALAAADVGIALGAIGSDAAIESADIALMSDDLSKLPWLWSHSRRTVSIIRENIVFALGVKLLFVILATLGVATLWMAIAADTGASLLVIFNALRLLRK